MFGGTKQQETMLENDCNRKEKVEVCGKNK